MGQERLNLETEPKRTGNAGPIGNGGDQGLAPSLHKWNPGEIPGVQSPNVDWQLLGHGGTLI